MTTDQWPEIRKHLDAVLDVDPGQRSAYLDRECRDDAVRAEVEAFLHAEDEVAAFMEQRPAARMRSDHAPTNREQERLGAYRLGALIGHGGMGEIYLARRDDAKYEQQVAVKILQRGLHTREIIRRFERERRILASLEHNYIARILDAGETADGLPYFVMERVEGIPIDEYCARQSLGRRQTLELFLKVCDAVHFAHRNLVIHCDLKPANILIDSAGNPKLLDFGIAKLLRPDDPGSTRGLLPMGTPGWTSPEQQEPDKPVTTASDVYILGVLLRRLLSARSSKDAKRKKLPRDLETIVAKAKHLEPDLRYASANDLASDVRCYLEHRPVMARPGSALYRTTRFVQRHPIGALMAGLVVLFVIALYAQLQATLEQRDRARSLRDTVLELLASIDPTSDRASSELAIDAVEQALVTELSPQLSDRALMLDRVGRIYYRLGLLEPARSRLESSLEIRRTLPDVTPGTIATSLNNLALVLIDLGLIQEGLELLDEAVLLRREHDPDSAGSTITRTSVARALTAQGRYSEAESILRDALEQRARLHGRDSQSYARGLNNVATNLVRQGRFEEAEEMLTQAVQIWRELRGHDDTEVAKGLINLAVARDGRKDYSGAIVLHREAVAIRRRHFGDSSPESARAYGALAFSLLGSGSPHELTEAEIRLRGALRIYTEAGQGTTPNALVFRRNLAATRLARGDSREAEHLAREVLELSLTHLGPDHWRIADAKSVLGHSLLAQKRYAEAEPLLVDSLPVILAATGEHSRYAREARQRLEELRRSTWKSK